jgi:two-component system OmpR family sensor kinase
VTLAFVVAMAVVLFAIGLLIHARYESELNSSIDRGLRSRAGDVATLLRASNGSSNVLPNRAESFGEDAFAQVLTASRRVLDTSGGSAARPVLDRGQLSAAARGTIFFERGDLPGIDDRARLLASSVQANGRRLIVVVGTSTDDREEALRTLATLLWLGGAGALLLASLAGYAAVTASLRPVEAIRRQAEEISAADLAQRLPVPAADDELRRLGETLNQMLARLETALERERAFVDDASHELRTPLTLHRAELEVALRHAESPAELRDAISSAIEEVDRLSQLAEDLLVLARAGKGRLAVQRRRVEVEPLMASVRDRFRTRAEASGYLIELEPADGLAVDADRLRLEQALSNLLDNALRHGSGPIRLSATRAGSRVQLHVRDAGEGFAAEFLPRAFERFSRADEARTSGGTGLGLAIVEAIAAAHGGSVGAANNDGGGADVWIELPIDGTEPLSRPIHPPGVERAGS